VADVNQLFADAVAKHQAGDVSLATRLYRMVIAEAPNHAPALCNLGTILAKQGKADESLHCYQLALQSVPGYPEAHYNLGNLYRRAGQNKLAIDQYTACLKANPQHISAGFNLGLALLGIGDMKAAKHCLAQVVALDPKFADGWGRLGDLNLRMGEPAEAVAAFQKYAELQPDDARGKNNLALALANVGRHADAIDILQKLVKVKPDYAEAHNTLGVTLEAIGKKDDALFHYDAAVKAKPDFADAWSNRGINLLESGRADEAVESLQKSVHHRPGVPAVHSNLLLAMNYPSSIPIDLIADEHKSWGTQYGGETPAIPKPADPNPNRVLKIGYVSSDFRAHTVAGFIEAVFANHDRKRFHVTAYANVIRPDDVTEKLKGLADAWVPAAALSDEALAHKVRVDGIDILIDLAGHTAGNRLLTFARRPAPMQATLFGYPNTTGIPAVDFRISDAISDPPGQTESFSTETLIRLPNLAWVYAPPANLPPVGLLPALTKKGLTFGCLNNAAKISDDCLAAWSKVLQATPGSKLILLAGQSNAGAKRLADRFTKAGILRDRVELIFRLPKEQYYQAYSGFDIALDPFPYNGGVTTCDSLAMGVPVLTVEGASYVARQGLAVLANLGLPGFIARTPVQLVELAKSWNSRRQELATIRSGLREQLRKSPICDAAGYVRNLEDALIASFKERAKLWG
jgi:predicted O-linked N-acetylglucosamine transferase (SPINDLY family)